MTHDELQLQDAVEQAQRELERQQAELSARVEVLTQIGVLPATS
jgi:hypothetical protein